jgi:outer membrane protein assembly factor BamE (lipoprotein component of BamABCDE complex)
MGRARVTDRRQTLRVNAFPLWSAARRRPCSPGGSWRVALTAVLMAGALGACSVIEAPTRMRGHRVDQDIAKELVPGTSTKADVMALLGSPTKTATFDDDKWIYIASVTRTRIGRYPGLDSQDVTVLSVTPQGTLKEIGHLTQEDALPVDVVDRVTPTPGSERTFMQELLGSVGRLNPGVPVGGGSGRTPGGSGGQIQ